MDLYLFSKVVDKYLAGTATENEQKLVEAYWERFSSQNEIPLTENEKEFIRVKIHEGVQRSLRGEDRHVFIQAENKTGQRENGNIFRNNTEDNTDKALVVPISRRTYFKRIAAAAIILIIAGVTYFSIFKPGGLTSETTTTGLKNDISPANQGATLTLADGRIISLDSTSNGSLLNNDGINITKNNDQLTYESENLSRSKDDKYESGSISSPFEKGGRRGLHENTDSRGISYNTLSTAKGRSYHLKLSDGTTVWLDAMSSLKYPAAFTGKDRTVEITGQAYFDIAKDPKKPFIVKSAQQTIEVLGTEFNINTYSAPVTTLINGSIKLSTTNSSVILKPSEQSILKSNFVINKSINIDNVTAWKNNKFYFDGSTIEEIMTEISRWYDIDVEYKSKLSEEFVAKISRDVPLSRLLNLLEMTNQVKFNIEGKKITVIKP